MLTCHQPSKITEDALQEQAKWEDWTKDLAIICEHCSSTEACVSLWVRALPLISGGAASPIKAMFPYRANSRDQFLKWPLGKQRAAEFQRGREVKRWLEICNVEGREQWSLTQIVGWARRYAHTPLPYRKILRTDNKNQMEILPLEDPDLVCGCEWVGRRASEIKVNLPMEEFQPGIVVDVTKAVAWKAVLSFMEDLLRASHSQAWQENSNHVVVPPKTISFKHVKAALSFTRPEFDLFTCDGLGTVAELVE
ncbi:hypothetical protein SK128_016237 [Halocaridina rubra]|uniref:YEATS domain-containing protein n=1 Tax=Halocaridina rubra TaxID=373956 RepID=A0AAN8XSW5_HALRR